MSEGEVRERIEQLHEGTVGAAAALPEAHSGLGSEAVELADRLRVAAAAGDASPAALAAALEALEAVHMDLLRIKVRGREAASLEVEEGMSRLRERVRELDAGGG